MLNQISNDCGFVEQRVRIVKTEKRKRINVNEYRSMPNFQIATVSPNNGFFCRDRIGYLEVGKVENIRKA